MAKTQRQPFTPRGPFIVARPFRWEGRDYKPGEDFEAKRMAVNQRRLQLLYDAKNIDVKGDYLPQQSDAGADVKSTDLSKLEKKDLLALAAERGITIAPKATKDQIIEALEAPPKPADNTPPVDLVAAEGEFLFDTELHAVEEVEDEHWITDEAEFLVQISPNAAERLRELTKSKSLVTALEILAWPDPEATEN